MLGYVDKLNELDTAAVEPTAQVGESGTPMREDAVTNHPAAEAMLANAPAREGFFSKSPKLSSSTVTAHSDHLRHRTDPKMTSQLHKLTIAEAASACDGAKSPRAS